MTAPIIRYATTDDLPGVIPLFPLSGALLLPRANVPFNIFEPRYLAMVDWAMSAERVIGMVQPRLRGGAAQATDNPSLEAVGCAGRISSYTEVPDGRYLITLTGIARFRIVEELSVTTPFRQAGIDFSNFTSDLEGGHGEDAVDRPKLLATLAEYVRANNLSIDWDSVAGFDNETLVNALSMMCPYGAREKQALLEADGLANRAEVLIAMTEMALAQNASNDNSHIQ